MGGQESGDGNGNVVNHEDNENGNSVNNGETQQPNQSRPKTMTQGDRLNAIKAKKQAASCGNVPVEKLKGHVRVKSVPNRTNMVNNNGTSAALSSSRPLTRMQAEQQSQARSPKRTPMGSPSRKSNAVR